VQWYDDSPDPAGHDMSLQMIVDHISWQTDPLGLDRGRVDGCLAISPHRHHREGRHARRVVVVKGGDRAKDDAAAVIGTKSSDLDQEPADDPDERLGVGDRPSPSFPFRVATSSWSTARPVSATVGTAS
jgi:hypothetical protein